MKNHACYIGTKFVWKLYVSFSDNSYYHYYQKFSLFIVLVFQTALFSTV